MLYPPDAAPGPGQQASRTQLAPGASTCAPTVDAAGALCALGGRQGLALVDLSAAPGAPAHRISRQSIWDVSQVRFSPHLMTRGHLAAAVNTAVLLWDVHAGTAPFLAKLRRHTRVITGVAWAPLDPAVLASCAADACVHIRDVRAPRSPA